MISYGSSQIESGLLNCAATAMIYHAYNCIIGPQAFRSLPRSLSHLANQYIAFSKRHFAIVNAANKVSIFNIYESSTAVTVRQSPLFARLERKINNRKYLVVKCFEKPIFNDWWCQKGIGFFRCNALLDIISLKDNVGNPILSKRANHNVLKSCTKIRIKRNAGYIFLDLNRFIVKSDLGPAFASINTDRSATLHSLDEPDSPLARSATRYTNELKYFLDSLAFRSRNKISYRAPNRLPSNDHFDPERTIAGSSYFHANLDGITIHDSVSRLNHLACAKKCRREIIYINLMLFESRPVELEAKERGGHDLNRAASFELPISSIPINTMRRRRLNGCAVLMHIPALVG